MAKYYLLKFQFTHTEADNERISATDAPSTIWVFYFFMILGGKAAIIDFMFFYHHNAVIWFASDSPASNGFAAVWHKLLTEDDGNLPQDFLRVSGLRCPSTVEGKQTPCTAPWRSWPSQIQDRPFCAIFILCSSSAVCGRCLRTLKSSWLQVRGPQAVCVIHSPVCEIALWTPPESSIPCPMLSFHPQPRTRFGLSHLIPPWVCWRQSDWAGVSHLSGQHCLCLLSSSTQRSRQWPLELQYETLQRSASAFQESQYCDSVAITKGAVTQEKHSRVDAGKRAWMSRPR